MKSIKDIAKYINKNKPDISKFLSVLVEDTFNAPKLIETEQNPYVQALMAEIYILYCGTHPRIWIASSERLVVYSIYSNLVLESTLNNNNYWQQRHTYTIIEKFNESFHILAHIEEVRKYLPKYLWDKVRTKKELAKTPLKQLEDNPLSLKAFETYLKSVKKLTSVQAEEYLNQTIDFSLQEKYMDLIFSKCTPSEKLQKSLSEYNRFNIETQNNDKVSRYMYLNKYLMQRLVDSLNIPMFYELFDDRYSDYKPFITNVPRNINKNPQQLTYLYGCLITFKVANSIECNEVYQHFIKHLEEHLSHPDLQEELTKIKNNLNVLKQFI